MQRRTLNLGILAHVDAGKTTLTERLLHAAGIIDEIGSVDAGTTQTDSLALERQRGITIRSAVVSFAIDDVVVNLIDTPGHPDFIAEVERVLSVLDGAVLVVSAVEGVQPQTRVLMRALQRLRIPTVVFVNKLDRSGASDARVIESMRSRLGLRVVPMGYTSALGTRTAGFHLWDVSDQPAWGRIAAVLAEGDEGILASYVDDEAGISHDRLSKTLATQTAQGLVHPVFCGSAMTGAGVDCVMAGIAALLPASTGDSDGPAEASVFKIERTSSGRKVAYARMFSGTLRTRDQVHFGGDHEGKVTAIGVFAHGSTETRTSVSVGEIAALSGLDGIHVGDTIGASHAARARRQFPPPTLESVVVAIDSADRGRLRVALGQLAEQDPLINVRQDDVGGEISVSLYGEVQKEVVQATLAADFGVPVTFRETTAVCIERPMLVGEAVEVLHAESNPYLATIGLRVEPAPIDSGVAVRVDVDFRLVPLFVYKSVELFAESMGQYVREALQRGRYGWPVTDCVVTMTRCGYSSPDGSAATRGPLSTAADFRKLTPLVLRQSLAAARTVVCEPMVRANIETPTESLGAIFAAIARLGGVVDATASLGELAVIETELPAASAQALQRQLPGLTTGEGVLETSFAGYRPVPGAPPTRPVAQPERRTT